MTDLGQFQSPTRKAPRSRHSKWRRFRKNIFVSFFIDLLVIAGTALVLSLLIKTFLIRSFFIPSGSMLETLQIDDRIIVNELVPDVIPLERGDVVVFKDPGGWLGEIQSPELDPITAATDWLLSAFGVTAPDSSQHLVKRVIGVGGDHVVCCDADGKITINGTAITESYLQPGKVPSDMNFDVTVPEGSYWVMGDNRDNSADSRYHADLPSKGFVSKDVVVGRAFLVTWPFSNITWLDNYSDVSKIFPSLDLENELWSSGARFVIGMDEVGRGAIAGPVAVGVAVLDFNDPKVSTPWPAKLCDSKLISEKVRNEIVAPVSEWVRASAVGMVSAADIDSKGIVNALAGAGASALEQILVDETFRSEIVSGGAVIILDGSHNWIGPKASGINVVVRTKADRDCVSVAAASVVAKVARDNLMIELDKTVPGYDLAGHKGYASASHIEAVRGLGPSAEHRVTWLTKILA